LNIFGGCACWAYTRIIVSDDENKARQVLI